MKMNIDKTRLEKKIKSGQSSRVTAMQFGCSPTQIRREAAKIGLKFNGKIDRKKYAG